MKNWTRRDLTISDIDGKSIVIACDSCGSIGMKDGDLLRIPTYYVAKLTARVCLTEVMCSGATPIVISNGLANEMKPTGEECIKGIRDELAQAKLEDVILTGSTEENFSTIMTAMGLTVIGVSNKENLRFNKSSCRDRVILIGTPRVGKEVPLDLKGFYEEIRYLLSLPNVREIVPVGSKGIKHEVDALASLNKMEFHQYKTEIDMYKTAGPATCMIALCDEKTSKLISYKIIDTIVLGELN